MGKWQIVRLGVFACLSASSAQAAADKPYEQCEREWESTSTRFVNGQAQDYQGLLQAWRAVAPKCQSTGVYESRLAILQARLGDIPAARQTLLRIADVPDRRFAYLPALAPLFVDFSEISLHEAEPGADQKLTVLRGKFETFVQRFPDSVEGYSLLGAIETLTGEHASAVKNLTKALEGTNPPEKRFGALRNLAVSYAALDRFQEGFDAANHAYGINKKITDDAYFMLALARCQAGLNQFQNAQTTLRVVAAKRPDLVKTPAFTQVVHFLFERQKAAGIGGSP